MPPSRGSIEIVVFLFDVPADPEVYTNRTTWYAEHAQESTLAFYATDPMKNLVGPGIAQAEYGGAPFLLPPPPLPHFWSHSPPGFSAPPRGRRLRGRALGHPRAPQRPGAPPPPAAASG